MGHTTLVGCATVKVALPLFLSPFIVVAATSAFSISPVVFSVLIG
ncbi:hypothetical protein BVRB_6g148450 isoform A [Beta vulgaris subsp. vulgaris]|nr:hypothetical protein BVRB_6g148450 isoform A [Beta vulgaris subsp. vulgaris]